MGCDYEPSREEMKRAAEQERVNRLVRKLRTLPSSLFTVNELALLLRTGWGQFQTQYHAADCADIYAMARRTLTRIEMDNL